MMARKYSNASKNGPLGSLFYLVNYFSHKHVTEHIT